MQDKSKKILELLLNYEPSGAYPVVIDKNGEIYSGNNEAFISLIAYLYGNTNDDKVELDMIKGENKLYIGGSSYEYSPNFKKESDISETDQEKLTAIVSSDYSQNDTLNNLANVVFYSYFSAKYQNESGSDLKEFIDGKKDELRNLADSEALFNAIYEVAKRVQKVDEIFAYKNDKKISNLHKLELFKFEVARFERFADKVNLIPQSFTNDKGERIEYNDKVLYVSDQKLKDYPQLGNLVNRAVIYFYASPENSDFNKLMGGMNSTTAFKADSDTKIAIKNGKFENKYKIYQYDKSIGAFYTFAYILNPNYMQKNGYIGADKESFDNYENQISRLKTHWLEVGAIALPSIDEQRAEIYGDYMQKGKRIAVDGERNKTHIQTNENKPFFNKNAGLFNAESGFVEYDFKESKSYAIKDYDTIKCLSMTGFGTSSIIKKDFVADLAARETRLQELAKKERIKELEIAKAHLKVARAKTQKYNELSLDKNTLLHDYFKDHGVNNLTQNALMNFSKSAIYNEHKEKIADTMAIKVPYFAFDNEKRPRLYTIETIRYQRLDNGELHKSKIKTKDGRAGGAFAVVGVNDYNELLNAIKNNKTIHIAEGFATAMAVNRLTNEICLASGSINNFAKVVKDLANIRPDLELRLCIDNDCIKYPDGLGNPINFIKSNIDNSEYPKNTKIIAPLFSIGEKGTDWADKLVNNGVEKTRAEFNSNLMNLDEFSTNFNKIITLNQPHSQNEISSNLGEKL